MPDPDPHLTSFLLLKSREGAAVPERNEQLPMLVRAEH